MTPSVLALLALLVAIGLSMTSRINVGLRRRPSRIATTTISPIPSGRRVG